MNGAGSSTVFKSPAKERELPSPSEKEPSNQLVTAKQPESSMTKMLKRQDSDTEELDGSSMIQVSPRVVRDQARREVTKRSFAKRSSFREVPGNTRDSNEIKQLL